ncbi:unnamed protein product [Bursaphelenchus okinawaensis]|uniref:Battenin n=1 Tax=Bursaphelenchus okinawaensis TaxID=465554 RepID=A0A811JTR7_9BILA|nr:unnamed protein product [Bursaphelenchus okinawaensis]CAG9083393.1 unnamed protein product [Bursaphelenchus okinawaensis]
MPQLRIRSPSGWGNLMAFWILGLCNNFAYVIMLSSAKDILDMDNKVNSTDPDRCIPDMSKFQCNKISTGAVLLADIIPSLIIKFMAPVLLYMLAYNVRIVFTVFLMVSSFVVVAISTNVALALFGVTLASFGAGLGEVTFLALSSNFNNDVISSWSSGTGGAGVFGALTYAMLTERTLLNLSPKTSLIIMLVVPAIFFLTYWKMLISPSIVHKAVFWKPQSYVVPATVRSRSSSGEHEEDRLIEHSDEEEDEALPLVNEDENLTLLGKVRPLLKFMVPLATVYLGEYFINQGLLELLVFDCSHGFSMSVSSQYRWYQVLYQIGVFVSRSSSNFVLLNRRFLGFVAILQLFNATGILVQTTQRFIPHIIIVFGWIVFEGLLGGAAYVNTFRIVHKEVPVAKREFAMSFVSTSDSFGILLAGFAAIPVHNIICSAYYQFF